MQNKTLPVPLKQEIANPRQRGIVLLVPMNRNPRQREKTVEKNIARYKTELEAKGLTDALVAKFVDARTALADDKNKKYELTSARSALVQNNLGMFNGLYDQFAEICSIGEVLYKQTDKAKLNDYTFAYLMKQVRRADKPDDEKPDDSAPED